MPLPALAAGGSFLSGLSGLMTRQGLMAAATYGPLIFQAASQLNNRDPTRDTSDNVGAALGSLAVGVPGALLGARLGNRGGRSLAYRTGEALNPDAAGLRRGGRVGGTIGGALGGLALAGVGANVGQGVVGLTKGDALSQQIRTNERLFESQARLQREAQEASLPLMRSQQDLALRGYADQMLLDERARGLDAYRSALYGVVNRPPVQDNGFSTALAQYALGGFA
jgi:hypothetical protein